MAEEKEEGERQRKVGAGVPWAWDGNERRRVQPEVRLPSWVATILITILLVALSAAFSVGVTYMQVQADTERIRAIESHLQNIEEHLNRIDTHIQANSDELDKHEQEINRLDERPRR